MWLLPNTSTLEPIYNMWISNIQDMKYLQLYQYKTHLVYERHILQMWNSQNLESNLPPPPPQTKNNCIFSGGLVRSESWTFFGCKCEPHSTDLSVDFIIFYSWIKCLHNNVIDTKIIQNHSESLFRIWKRSVLKFYLCRNYFNSCWIIFIFWQLHPLRTVDRLLKDMIISVPLPLRDQAARVRDGAHRPRIVTVKVRTIKRDFHRCTHQFPSDSIKIWTACAFWVLGPLELSLSKQSSLKRWKVIPKSA